MASIKDRLTARLDELRQRVPIVDHLINMQGHYGKVQASQQAGAVTYFAFLSVFPILALAFFVVGIVAKVYSGATDNLTTAFGKILPGLIGNGDGQIQIADIQSAAAAAGIVGAITLLYSGLSWLSALRQALITVFELPKREQPNFVVGKVRDLLTLASIGFVLVFSVAVSGVLSGFSKDFLHLIGLGDTLSPLVKLITVVLGLAANALLFFTMYKLLTDTDTPQRSLWEGAVLGAVGFEILKRLSNVLLSSTKGQPAFQAFGIALILVVWINYFTRLVMYAAAFAYTTPEAIAARGTAPEAPVQGPATPDLSLITQKSGRPAWVTPFAAGGAAMLGVVAFVRSRGAS